MNKWFEVTFQVFNAQVWQFTVQVRHAYDAEHAVSIAKYLIKPATMMELVSVREIVDQVPAETING